MTLDYFYGQAGELFSFYRIPKALFQEPRFQSLSTDAKTLYGILLDRMSLSAKNGWLDEQGRVFIIFTIEDHGEFSEERLIRALGSVHPMEIFRVGRDNPAKLPGWKKYVFPIYMAYNGKGRKDALPMKF